MKKYKKGTKFTVSTHKELCNKGWHLNSHGTHYTHDDFLECEISHNMIQSYAGKTLTVKKEDQLREDWYNVDENKYYIWPVATFLSDYDDGIIFSCKDGCVEGMTEIFGWIICKNCGIDLREIK